MARTISFTETLEVTQCWCGMSFAVPDVLNRKARDEGVTIYCPLGHTCHWGETEADKLRKQLKTERESVEFWRLQERVRREEAEHEKNRANGYKGALTKTKKRVGKGACPCCNRVFVNVQRHMTTQHPDYAEPADS